MPTNFSFPLSSFQKQLVNLDRLNGEIERGISVALAQDPALISGNVVLDFASNIADPSNDLRILKGIIEDHDGLPYSGGFKFIASSTLLSTGEFTVTSQTFVDVAGVVTSVGFFLSNHRLALGRIVGEASANGGGSLELQLVKENGASLTAAPWVVANTNGAWTKLGLLTDKPPVLGTQLYRLQARVTDGATTGKLRYVSLTMVVRT